MAGSDESTMPTARAEAPAAPSGAHAATASAASTPGDSAASAPSNAVPPASSGAVEPEKQADQGEDEGDKEEENEDDEPTVTLHEVLREQSELNDAAEAVLGDASDDHCSYELGYLRQALYACLTCTPGPLADGRVAGVCLACSYHCHADHEIVELYTKRDFRCDCGNARFPEGAACQLAPDKSALNERNAYSHNFVGTYCSCARPYPDPERTTPEIMVQCVVCEDWLHEEHIFEEPRALPEAFDELVCQPCMAKHPFLAAYQLLEQDDNDDNEGERQEDETEVASECVLEKLEQRLATEKPDPAETDATTKIEPTFWSREWRTRLCACSKCVARMEKHRIAFLMDPEDTLQAYEERARELQQQLSGAPTTTSTTTTTTIASGDGDDVVSSTVASAMSTLEEAAQRAFQSKLSHEQQVEMAMGYNLMKEKLQTYLSTFAASGKTVRAQDIQEFFQELREAKRQRLN